MYKGYHSTLFSKAGTGLSSHEVISQEVTDVTDTTVVAQFKV
jgi:hypothetical protein